MYHRVLTDSELAETASHPGIVVRRETFASQMALLTRTFRVLSLRDFTDRMGSGAPFDSGSCLITFDDGWSDNFTNALPVLREHGLPAVVFLPVNYIGSQRMFWREHLTGLLRAAVRLSRSDPDRRAGLEGALSAVGLRHLLDVSDGDARGAICTALDALKGGAPERVRALTAELTAVLGTATASAPVPDSFIDWPTVNAMVESGITFGGHGAEHWLLTSVSDADAQREIVASAAAIRDQTGQTATAFAYPNGDWSPQVAEHVRRAGFRIAFTTEPGFVTTSDQPFALRRLNIHESLTATPAMFMARLVGLF